MFVPSFRGVQASTRSVFILFAATNTHHLPIPTTMTSDLFSTRLALTRSVAYLSFIALTIILFGLLIEFYPLVRTLSLSFFPSFLLLRSFPHLRLTVPLFASSLLYRLAVSIKPLQLLSSLSRAHLLPPALSLYLPLSLSSQTLTTATTELSSSSSQL